MSAVIGATHVLCAIGSGTEQVWASARAGIARIGNSHVMDRHFEPIQMGLVPEDALGAARRRRSTKLPLPSRARRMLRLAAPSFQAVAKGLGRPVPVFLGLPAADAGRGAVAQARAGVPAEADRRRRRSRSAASSCRTAARLR